MKEDLNMIGGDASGFIRACLRSGIAYYKSAIENVNSEERHGTTQNQPETAPVRA